MSRDAKILALVVIAMGWMGVALRAASPVQIGDSYHIVQRTPWWFTLANVAAFALVVLAARHHGRGGRAA